MIKFDGLKIAITRGDYQPFTITLTGEDVPVDGTKVLFTVAKENRNQEPVIRKIIPLSGGTIEIVLESDDTRLLPYGKYEWNIRILDIYGNGKPYTPMYLPALFEIVRVIGDA